MYNVGIICDKMLVNMKFEFWDLVININLFVIECVNDYLFVNEGLNVNGCIVCVLLILGIVGNLG